MVSKMKAIRKIHVSFFCIVLLVFSTVFSLYPQGSNNSVLDSNLQIFEQIYRFVQEHYVDEPDSDVLIHGALKGMLESLDDPHTAFLDIEAMRHLTDTTSGEFGGVGMYIGKPVNSDSFNYIEVISPIEDTPAFLAGLRAGDKIKMVEDTLTDELSVEEAANLLRGVPGSEVKITVLRGDDLEFAIVLERALIQIPTIKSAMIDDTIAFLRIIQFTPHTAARVAEALQGFNAAGYRSLIVDLRSNPGGLLSGVVDVANLFFDTGLIVETKSRIENENQRYFAKPGKLVASDIQIVVLIDDGSASASEILAGALKDRGRATLIGETTYGKGSVQHVRSVGDVGFRLTVARYYTPSGQNIDKIGVAPDIEVLEPELSSDEQEAYVRIQEEDRVGTFVSQVNNPTETQIRRFIDELEMEGVVLNERYVRRMVRIEVNRVMNKTDVYDIDYDIVLQRAIQYLKEKR